MRKSRQTNVRQIYNSKHHGGGAVSNGTGKSALGTNEAVVFVCVVASADSQITTRTGIGTNLGHLRLHVDIKNRVRQQTVRRVT